MEMNPKVISISKLRDDNGYKWSYEMKMLLGSKDLWKNCEYRSEEEYSDGQNWPKKIDFVNEVDL